MFVALALSAFLIQTYETDNVPPGPAPVPMPAWSDSNDDTTTLDLNRPCPAVSLYLMLKLLGRNPDFSKIVAKLGHTPDGVSISQFCGIAREFGLHLHSVELQERDLTRLRGPFVAFLKPCSGSGTGHYAVARTVGDGSRIQLIDPPEEPGISDRSEVFRPGAWCRIELVPEASLRVTGWSYPIGVGAIGAFGTLIWLGRRRSRGSTLRSAIHSAAPE